MISIGAVCSREGLRAARKERAAAGVLAVFLAGLAAIAGCGTKGVSGTPESALSPPVAAVRPVELVAHEDTRIDDYFWLRERDDPEVIAYLEAENEYTGALMAHTEDLQETLFEEMVERISPTDESVPWFRNGYYYYDRYDEGSEYPVYCRKKGSLDAEEEVMLNVQDMAEGHEYYHVTGLAVSEDNRFLAFGVDTLSRRKYTIRVKDLESGELLDDSIPVTTGRAVWANDGRTLFYSIKDEETLRPWKVARHVTGTDAAQDAVVYEETDPTFNVYVTKSKSAEYIFIASTSTLSSEYRFLDASAPDGGFTLVEPRSRGHEYEVRAGKDCFYILTNLDAENFRLMRTPVSEPSAEHWTELIPHRSDVLLEGVEPFDSYLVLSERRGGLPEVRVMELDGKADYYVDFDDEAYDVYVTGNHRCDTATLRFEYSSLTTPNTTYDYDMDTREMTLLKRDEVLGGFDPEDYESRRLYAEARDGTKVPVSLLYRKGTVMDGENPLLLYGYGSYGYSIDASFRSYRFSIVDRGFIFAIAHIRGGQEMGRRWYEDGKLLKKKNTFTDFIDCGEFLCAEGYTRPEKLFAMGGSAGGLLIGAVVNMRPDLFEGVVASVPWVDVVTTMLDETIPLTTSEYDEWGDPNVKEYYDYMLSYSPYDNVAAVDYPAMLVTTGLHDSQVQYWEPAKWVAKMRATGTGNSPLLLHTNMGAGHSGASGRFERYRETALEFAFLLDLAGIGD